VYFIPRYLATWKLYKENKFIIYVCLLYCVCIEILDLNTEEKIIAGLDVFKPYQCSIKVQLSNASLQWFPYEFSQEAVVLKFNSSTISRFTFIPYRISLISIQVLFLFLFFLL